MNTKKMTTEWRMAYWAGKIKERAESGQSIKEYCQTAGIQRNSYFYWQRKLREAASKEIAAKKSQNKSKEITVPSGWAVCKAAEHKTNEGKVYIQIGKCRVEAAGETDTELLTKVCRMLIGIEESGETGVAIC
jgi:putative transposase